MTISGFAEPTLEVRDLPALERCSVEDREGDVAEVRDCFERGEGAVEGTVALAREPD